MFQRTTGNYDPKSFERLNNVKNLKDLTNTLSDYKKASQFQKDLGERERFTNEALMSPEQKAVNQQVDAYREMTEITKQEIARKRDEENAEKRRIEEKQIRSLRRNYRSQGLLGQGAEDNATKLGG